MNQTRLFLIFAWLMVATLLWMEWGKEKAAPTVDTAAVVANDARVPASTAPVPAAPVPAAPGSVPAATPGVANAVAPGSEPVEITTDVLHVVLDGGELRQADLLKYPTLAAANSEPVRLFADDDAHYFVARSGWTSTGGIAPGQEGAFRVEGARDYQLDGQQELSVPFVWSGSNGVTIRRTFTFQRGSYVVQVRDEVVNAGTAPWQGYIYRQLSRVPRAIASSGPMNAEKYSFQGAAWFNGGEYEKRKFDKFAGEALDEQVTGGWVGMLQHHFFAAWIPQKDQPALYGLGQQGNRYTIEAKGPSFSVAAGGKDVTTARLWVGPKLVKQIDAQQVKGL